VTSRARLQLRGEQDLAVSPLAVPRVAGDPPSLAGLAGVAAVRLFVERAQAVQADFALTDQNRDDVAEVCRRLDGLPLAIELAAARVRVLPPRGLLAHLGRASGSSALLPLLTGGARDAPAHQRTMPDTIAWSHDLLSPDEQWLFRRLAAFVGGWTLEAAIAVAGASGNTAIDLVNRMESLVNQSMVLHQLQSDDQPRFGMLETVREYGLDRLAVSGEEATARQAHAACYLALAERAELELTGPEQAHWFDQLETEHANLRAALTWSLDGDHAATALRLVGALWWFWQVRGYVSEGRAWAEAALNRGGDAAPAIRARALRAAGLLAEYHGDYDQAVARHEAAAVIWRELGEEGNLARTLDHLGNCAHDRGDLAGAMLLHEQALNLTRRVGDTRGIASALGNLGIMAIYAGQLDRARRLLEETLSLMRESGNQYGIALALSNLGEVAIREEDAAQAVALNQEALALWQALGTQESVATALVNLGESVRLLGQLTRAERLYEEGRAIFATLGNKRCVAQALHGLGTVALAAGKAQSAAAHFGAGLALAWEVDDKLNMADYLEGIAGTAVSRGRGADGACLLGAAAALRDTTGAPVAAHRRATYDQIVAATRTGLDASAFDAAWDAGRGLPLARAIAEARGLAEYLAEETTGASARAFTGHPG
jgi:predicted ATPase